MRIRRTSGGNAGCQSSLEVDLYPGAPTLVLFFRSSAGWSVQRGNLLTDDRIVRRFVDIDLRPVRVVFGNVSVRENRFHRTLRHTRIAIDARGVDEEAVVEAAAAGDGLGIAEAESRARTAGTSRRSWFM